MQIRKLFFDRENNLWIGSYGSGLFQYYESAFSQLLQKINNNELSFTSLYNYNEFLLGATNDGKIYRININAPQQYNLFEIKELQGLKINSLFVDNNLILWMGTENKGLFLLDLVSGKIIKHIFFQDELQNNISSIDGFGTFKCVGTKNGLLIFNTEEKGYEYQKITTAEGLPHNYINQVLCDVQENVWIVTPTNFITKYNFISQKITLNKININDILKINAICVDNKKQTWIATYGNGVFKIDTAIYNYTASNGLFSDYTYSVASDESGTIWVGHRQGISSIKGNAIRTFSKNIGLYADCNPNSICVDKNGSVWFGTTKGILRYDVKKSIINKHPPTVLVTSIKINDVENTIDPYIELESGRYKIQFSFTGISLRESEGVTFQYMLEGYDAGWSEITNNRTALYPRLDEGVYTFKVLAYNYDKVVSKKPYTIVIRILPPFYKRWWFILLAVIAIAYIFYLIIKIRERNLRRMEKILKEKLDQRTKEVVKQKELIEHKNKDITDSIQYAKRIQEAILPSLRILHENFPNSFVFYQPRDIVSGDFYMFHPFGNKFIFICADATGHGVPGAFMSLISSTILKDILHLQESIRPSELLYKLDKEISGIFNQDNSETQDGLDLSVCLFDQETNILTYSAAMRPLIIFSEGKWTYYKGNRNSIGFSKYHIQKVFTDTEIKLYKGDRFYLFTDGLPDQFSYNEQKLKVSGLIHWLEEMQNIPMIIQQAELQKRLLSWKENQVQIDDILIMGIEV
ncbi:MAG TPA: two-component regulator propeller domain-containing protein, partial [Bacteroidales bacterium]|nr:two-component regulator propeller domain-containing protein [Bacteroidales bacterium]